MSDQLKHKARYVMVGGFLGAGKTTAVARLAEHFTNQGLAVGLITNDQGSELVDTAMLKSRGFAVEQIPGGCFCCRFNSLTEAAQKLTDASRPDVFIAEPVGSCTDLVATVTYPLRRIYGEDYSIAPLSVLVDPIRALRIFGLEVGGKFSEKVVYIYLKQLAEADLIIVNKIDLLTETQREMLRMRLEAEFPRAQVLEISARAGEGLEAWFESIATAEQQSHEAMEVDYETYAEGEALLGWLNCTVELSSEEAFDADEILLELARSVQSRLKAESAEIAHFKMTFSPHGGIAELAVINLVRNDYVPELSQTLDEPVSSGQLIINLRAEGAPELLKEAVAAGLEQLRREHAGLRAVLDHLEFFRPGKPQPTHRFTT